MDLALDISLAKGFKAGPQIARVVTEGWFASQMYCPGCASNRLSQNSNNTPVVDHSCSSCGAEYQVKAKASQIGRKLRDAAYEPMRQRIENGTSPHFAFLQYDSVKWVVRTLLLVPGHFLNLSAIERCKPLSARARRAGWVGCNILTWMLPNEAKVFAVANGVQVPPSIVRRQWQRFSWLQNQEPEVRAWTADILRVVKTFKRAAFTLNDVYAFEAELSKLHPANRHVRDKIRQQMQVLRDRGVLRFLGRGAYSML
ncbi:Type-2 restriction enzyme DpnI [Planctomycetaceae bacterium]|nr:Type-2 restriction enzyme DpnI [Planctomycetaceae bacterium]